MFGIMIDRSSQRSVTAQLCDQIRRKVESGDIPRGTRLPSTRQLAKELGIARNVAIEAYEQLIAEGYLVGRVGSGTFVAEGIAPSAGPQPLVPSRPAPPAMEPDGTASFVSRPACRIWSAFPVRDGPVI